MVLGGGAVSYERGNLVEFQVQGGGCREGVRQLCHDTLFSGLSIKVFFRL